MYVDLWVVAIFAVLFGICAIWNRNIGFRDGIQATLQQLLDDKMLSVVNNKIVPYRQQQGE